MNWTRLALRGLVFAVLYLVVSLLLEGMITGLALVIALVGGAAFALISFIIDQQKRSHKPARSRRKS